MLAYVNNVLIYMTSEMFFANKNRITRQIGNKTAGNKEILFFSQESKKS